MMPGLRLCRGGVGSPTCHFLRRTREIPGRLAPGFPRSPGPSLRLVGKMPSTTVLPRSALRRADRLAPGVVLPPRRQYGPSPGCMLK